MYMAGHSQFKNIMHRKGAQDKKRARIFARLSREIMVAAKTGGGDPSANPRLRTALVAARSANMPKDNIQRILDKADKNDGQEILYEAFANDGVGLLIKAYTDNVNRTVAELRHTLTKNGGSLGNPGTVMWMFEEILYLNDYKVKIPVKLTEESRQKLDSIIDSLEELDDIENIWDNAE